MDEENVTQALMIGVTTMIAVVTITAIIIFFNTSLKAVESFGGGMDFDTVYRNDIESALLMNNTNNYIKGTSVQNLISYYVQNTYVTISINNIKYIDRAGNVQIIDNVTISSTDYSVRQSAYDRAMRYLMDNQDFTINVETLDQDLGSRNITIRGV